MCESFTFFDVNFQGLVVALDGFWDMNQTGTAVCLALEARSVMDDDKALCLTAVTQESAPTALTVWKVGVHVLLKLRKLTL